LLKQEQRQTVSQRIDPKLIMANAILQQNSMELAQHIEAELLENPALDVLEQEPACNGSCPNPDECPYCSRRQQTPDTVEQSLDIPDADLEADFMPGMLFEAGDEEYDPLAHLEAEVTLQDHLRGLLRSALETDDIWIGEYLINCLDDMGWLGELPEDIAMQLGIELSDVMRVLSVLQAMDPPGVGARDLQECMLLQLRHLAEEGKPNRIAEKMVTEAFADVVQGRISRLARVAKVSVDTARQTLDFIRTQLNPYPASAFRPPWASRPVNHRSSIRPDVIVRRTQFNYDIEVMGAETFLLGINPNYRQLYDTMRNGNGHAHLSEEDRRHVTEYVERAELFIRNLHQRRRTLKLITRCIVECQQGFIDTGNRAFILPLTRTRVADMLGLHESTVSRATSKKFVQLPNQEVVPFDLFFNGSLAIKSAIEEIIAAEDPTHPLSDQRIVELLAARGIDVARRTVVKYRDAQKILSSNRRRR
jgi:RNA polymerase sigma-54 factor